MLTAITMFVIAASAAVSSYFIQKRIDKIQEQINDLKKQIYDITFESERAENLQRAINDNLDKQIKSQYSHFTSRMDKLKNDVLQNTRQY
jgi:cell division protein FtsL